MRTKTDAALAFVLLTVVLDVLAYNLVGPALPRLVQSVSGMEVAGVAGLTGAFFATFALVQFFASPTLGALSDRYGRRAVILISAVGLGLDYLIMALAQNVAWLLAGRVVSGAMAGSVAAAYAYVSDITAPEQRAARFGLIGAASGLGVALGPLLGGYLASHELRAPFWLAAVLSLASAAYGYFVLPESLPPDRRSVVRLSSLNPIGALAGLWREFNLLRTWTFISLVFGACTIGLNSIFPLYVTYRLAWAPSQIGLFVAVLAVVAIGIQGFAVGAIVKRLGVLNTLLIGSGLQVLAMGMGGFALDDWQIWVAGVVLMLGGVNGPVMSAILNNYVGAAHSGRLAGASASISAASFVIGPVIFSAAFALGAAHGATHFLAGAPFFLAASLMLLATLAIAAIAQRTIVAQPS